MPSSSRGSGDWPRTRTSWTYHSGWSRWDIAVSPKNARNRANSRATARSRTPTRAVRGPGSAERAQGGSRRLSRGVRRRCVGRKREGGATSRGRRRVSSGSARGPSHARTRGRNRPRRPAHGRVRDSICRNPRPGGLRRRRPAPRVRAGLRDGSVPVDADGGRLHDSAVDTYVVVLSASAASRLSWRRTSVLRNKRSRRPCRRGPGEEWVSAVPPRRAVGRKRQGS